MRSFSLFFALCVLFTSYAIGQDSRQPIKSKQKSAVEEFFSPLEPPLQESNSDWTLSTDSVKLFIPKTKWKLRPLVSLPALKITQSTREDAEADVFLLTSTGGGISFQKLEAVPPDQENPSGKWKSTFSWSPLTVLLSGNLAADDPIDLSLATTVGFFNNLLMFGVGYDLGTVEGRGRGFGVVSIGINFNNQ